MRSNFVDYERGIRRVRGMNRSEGTPAGEGKKQRPMRILRHQPGRAGDVKRIKRGADSW